MVAQLWKANPGLFTIKNLHGGRGHQDTSTNIGRAYFVFDKNNSIKSISKVEWLPIITGSSTIAAVVKAPLPPVLKPAQSTSVTVSELKIFSIIIDKNDPQLLSDKMMNMWNYSSNSLFLLDDENIVGRIGEIALHRQYPSMDWFNKDMELVGPADFNVNGNLTIDVKTIKVAKNNLLIKKKKYDSLSLADVFALALVEDIGSSFRVSFLGFISKEAAIAHIINYPPCYMPMIDSYKIDKRYLKLTINLDLVFRNV